MDILSAWLIENTSAIISRGRSSNPIGEKTKYFYFFSCDLMTATFQLMQSDQFILVDVGRRPSTLSTSI